MTIIKTRHHRKRITRLLILRASDFINTDHSTCLTQAAEREFGTDNVYLSQLFRTSHVLTINNITFDLNYYGRIEFARDLKKAAELGFSDKAVTMITLNNGQKFR